MRMKWMCAGHLPHQQRREEECADVHGNLSELSVFSFVQQKMFVVMWPVCACRVGCCVTALCEGGRDCENKKRSVVKHKSRLHKQKRMYVHHTRDSFPRLSLSHQEHQRKRRCSTQLKHPRGVCFLRLFYHPTPWLYVPNRAEMLPLTTTKINHIVYRPYGARVDPHVVVNPTRR